MKNKRLSLIVTLALCCLLILPDISVLYAAESAPAPEITPQDSPQIRFDTIEKNIGNISVGTKTPFEFKIENVGNEKLVIARVEGHCGCTSVELDKRELAPGEATRLTGLVTLNTKGPFAKAIDVYSNDPLNRKTTLMFRGVVQREVNYSPEALKFNQLKLDEPSSRTLTVESAIQPPLQLEKISVLSNSNGLQAESIKAEIIDRVTEQRMDPQTSKTLEFIKYTLCVTIQPNLKINYFNGVIEIKTNSLKDFKLNIPFYGSMTPPLRTEANLPAAKQNLTPGDYRINHFPRTLIFEQINRGQPLSRQIDFTSAKTFSITDVNIGKLPIDSWRIEPITGGHRVIFQCIDLGQKSSRQGGRVEIQTSDSMQKTFSIPASFFVTNTARVNVSGAKSPDAAPAGPRPDNQPATGP